MNLKSIEIAGWRSFRPERVVKLCTPRRIDVVDDSRRGGALLEHVEFNDDVEVEKGQSRVVNLLRACHGVIIVADSDKKVSEGSLKPRLRRLQQESERIYGENRLRDLPVREVENLVLPSVLMPLVLRHAQTYLGGKKSRKLRLSYDRRQAEDLGIHEDFAEKVALCASSPDGDLGDVHRRQIKQRVDKAKTQIANAVRGQREAGPLFRPEAEIFARSLAEMMRACRRRG